MKDVLGSGSNNPLDIHRDGNPIETIRFSLSRHAFVISWLQLAETGMTIYKLGFTLSIGIMLCACLEPQPKPELNSIPSTEFSLEKIATGLNTPWGVTPLDTGGYLVTEKAGVLKYVAPDRSIAVVSGTPETVYAKQQAGMFDVMLAPDFSTSRQIYISYAYGDDKANGTAIFKGRLSEDYTVLENGTQIFKAAPEKDTASHFGGRMAFLADGTLLLTTGDGFTYREAAQDKGSHLGKILRLSPDGTPAPDNPFTGTEGVKPHIYSYGHRNVQGLAVDPDTGWVWAHEHGPRGGDELNHIQPGANYGWPLATTGTDYTGAKITPYKSLEGTQGFVKDWVPSIAPSGLVIYRGDMFSGWKGDAFVGGLASKSLRRVDLENGKAVGEEILLEDLSARIRDVRQDIDGALLLLANTRKDGEPAGGELWRITPK